MNSLDKRDEVKRSHAIETPINQMAYARVNSKGKFKPLQITKKGRNMVGQSARKGNTDRGIHDRLESSKNDGRLSKKKRAAVIKT